MKKKKGVSHSQKNTAKGRKTQPKKGKAKEHHHHHHHHHHQHDNLQEGAGARLLESSHEA